MLGIGLSSFCHVLRGERIRRAKLAKLERITLADQDFEIRAWEGFGIIVPRCYIIRRSKNRYTSFYLPSTITTRKNIKLLRIFPKSGWEAIIARLEKENFMSLPDSSVLGSQEIMPDGRTYIVEIKQGGRYRFYSYSNPELQKWKEAKHVVEIFHILKEEFPLKRVKQSPSRMRY